MRRVCLLGCLLMLVGCGRRGPLTPPAPPPALAELYAAAQAHPAADLWARIGRAEILRRAWLKAVDAFEAALTVDPRHAPSLAQLAGLKLAHGDRTEAERLIAELERHHGEDAEAQLLLGQLYGQLGETALSRASFEKALRLRPDEPNALLAVGRDALARGQLGRAAECRDRLLRRYPDQPEAKAFAVDVYRAEGRPDQVEKLLRQAWQAQPSGAARALLASFYLTAGRPAEALAINEAYLARQPDDGPAAIARAEALVRLGRGREAIRLLRQRIQREPRDPRVNVMLGRLLLQQNRSDEALAVLQEALRLAPSDTTLKLSVADLYFKHRRERDAADLYQRLGQEDPRLRVAIAQRMAMMAQAADPEGEGAAAAIEANYLVALQASPRDPVLLNNLAFHWAQQNKNLELARQMIDAVIAERGEGVELLDTRAWIAFRQKRYADAERDLQRVLQRQPGDPLATYHLAEVRAARGDKAAALKLAEQALTRDEPFIGSRDCQALLSRLKAER